MVGVCAVCPFGFTLVAWYTAAGTPWVSPATSSQPPSIAPSAIAVPVEARRARTSDRDQGRDGEHQREDLQEPEHRLHHRALGGVEADVVPPCVWALVAR